MDDQNKNLILATVLSFLVILVWFVFFQPEAPTIQPVLPELSETTGETGPTADVAAGVAPASADATPAPVVETIRIAIDTPRLTGSVALTGGRIDDLALRDYRTELDSPDTRSTAVTRRL